MVKEISIKIFKEQINNGILKAKELISFLLQQKGFTTNKDIEIASIKDLMFNGELITHAEIDNNYTLFLHIGQNKDKLLGIEFLKGINKYKVIEYLASLKKYRVKNFTDGSENELITKEEILNLLQKQNEFKEEYEKNIEYNKKLKEKELKEQQRENERLQQYNNDWGFTNNKTTLQKAKILKTLNKIVKYNNDFITRKDLIVKLIREDNNTYVKEVMLTNRYSNKKIGLEYKKLKDKLEYRLYSNDVIIVLTKTEYLFAEYLINNNIINTEIKEEPKESNNNKSYIVGNLCFNSYKEAYDYCISSDFDPDLMIKESVNSGTLKTNQLHNNKVKIKLLDKKINRLMNEYFKLKKEIDKQGIKYNDRDNILIQELNKLDNTMDRLDSRIDELMNDNSNITLNNFKLNLAALKEEYGDNKYKVINNNTGAILYANNNIDNYLYNKDYSIKFMLDNKEIFKQWINKNNNGLYSNCYIVYFYKGNDTKRNIEKKELYCLNTNKQLMQEIHKSKNNINILYCKAAINKEPLLLINGKQPTHDTLNKAREVFKKDNDIIDILENYTIREAIKPVIKTSKDNIELMLKDYREAINKFPKLKKLYENLEYYNKLYKNNYKQLLRKFKTNIIEFTNYKINYVFYKDYLLKLDLNTKEEIKYKAPLKVVYTTHYKQYIKK